MEDGLAARLAAIEETIAATNREERVDFFSDSDDSDF
jgi:membrane glycosyltransferase